MSNLLLNAANDFLLLDGSVELDINGTGGSGLAVTGTWGSTEATDTWKTPPFGTMGATEAKDTFAATGVKGSSPTIDGFVIGGAGDPTSAGITTANVTLSTTKAHDIIVVAVYTGGFWNHSTVSSITDTAGLTWTKRGGIIPTFNSSRTDLEVWWAQAPAVLTNDVITVTTVALTGNINILAFGVQGANYQNPWDAHSGLPTTVDNGANGNPTATISTSNGSPSSDMLLLFYGSADVPTGGAVNTPLTDFIGGGSQVEHNGFTMFIAGGWANVTGAQTSDVLSFTSSGGLFNGRALFADAIQGPIMGSMAATEAKDVSAETGSTLGGKLLTTEAKDTASMVGWVPATGTMAAIEHTDTMSVAGSTLGGTMGVTEAKDRWGTPPFGTMGATEAADAFHMVGGAIPDLTLDSFADGIAVTPAGGAAPTQVQATLSTTFNDDVIVVMVASGGFWDYHPVASVSDTAGLTWHRRASRPAAYSVTGAKNVEIWWAHAPTPLSADVITVTATGATGQIGVNVIAIAGANFSAPWDVHPYANQWNFRDAFFEPIETGFVSTHAAKTMTLLMGAGANPQSIATTNFPYTFLGTVGGEEHNGGNSLNVGSAYNINSTPQDQQLVKFGPNGHAYFYSDSIVQAGQTGTAQEILYYLDGFFWQIGTGVQIWPNNINIFTGTNGTVQCNISTSSPNEVIVAVVSLYNAGGAGQVSSIADSAGLASGWTRRSRKTTVDGTMALEVWYAIAPTAVGGMAITAHTSGTVANDYAQILAFGVVGATYFYDGILWDGDASLPDVATYTSPTTALGQVVTGLSTINMNTLDLAFMTNIDVTQPFNPAPGGAAAYPDALGPYANTNAPNDSIGVLFKFSGSPLIADLMSSNVSTKKWVTIGDALPVGPPQPPIGVWGSHEGVDIWSAAGFVPAFGTMNPTEHTDATGGAPNIAPFTGVGWLGWVPAFATWASTDSQDRAVAEGWVIGAPLTGVMGPTESKDRAALSNRATVTGTMGLTELSDRIASSGFEIPKALPAPPRKRRLLIVS